MTKTLQEIQEENRRLIICAVHKTDDFNIALDRSSYCPKVNIYGLNWVLFAISKITNCNPFESSNDLINLKVKNCFIDWNLEKETLELQEEIVQRSINKLLTENQCKK